MPANKKMIKVATTNEVPKNSLKTFDVNGNKILIANSGGHYYAIGAICKHEEWDLSEGELQGKKVTCAGHGAIWDLENGSAEFDEPLDKEPVFEVEVRGNEIFVNPEPK